jgi:hypothetical protein
MSTTYNGENRAAALQTGASLATHRMLARVVLAGSLLLTGCTQVGPDFIRPEAQVRQQWMEADDVQVRTSPAECRMWWSVFRDPVLDALVQTAYAQNIPLRLASAQGAVPRALIAIYRALGGGWKLREGQPFLPAGITAAMGDRTDWGGLLDPAAVQPRDRRQLLTPDW